MALQDIISKDLTAAMKAGDKLRTETLRSLRAQIIEYNKRGLNRAINEEEELSIITTAAKKRREAVEEFKKANRIDMADKEESELKIISEYLPKQLSEEEATEIVKRIVSESGAQSMKDIGKVMPAAMKELKGKIEGKIVQDIVKKILGS
jgi:uncharacterized protein